MRHPSCTHDPSECRLSSSGGTSTAMAWFPTYDGNGNRIGRGDPNIHTSQVSCSTCRMAWIESTQYGETTIGAARKLYDGEAG
jgi:YD repeat-containing protein